MDSIRTGLFANIGGQDQWLTFRGNNVDNPLLLIVGGPGVALSATAPLFEPWEREFTLVQWDQPGAGSTYGRNGEDGIEPFTLERLTQDAISVATFAAHYLAKEKLILLGFSGGSIIGLNVAARRPDLLSAYIGCGQIVRYGQQLAIGYGAALDAAREKDNATMLSDLERIGPPPWTDLTDEILVLNHLGLLTDEERSALVGNPELLANIQQPPADANYIADDVAIGDPRERGSTMYSRLRDEIFAFDAWDVSMTYEVPMFFFQGDQDYMTVTSEVRLFADAISAPHVEVDSLPNSSHAAFYLREQFLETLLTNVLSHVSVD